MPGRLPGFLFPGSTSKPFVTSPPSRGRGRMHRTADFCVRSLGHCDFDFDDFPRRGRRRARRRSWGKGSVAHLPNSCCHSFLKSPHCSKSSLSKGKALPRCPKSTLPKVRRCQKKKSPNVAGLSLDRACESEASDSSGRVPWPGRVKTSTRHIPGPGTGIWLVSFRVLS